MKLYVIIRKLDDISNRDTYTLLETAAKNHGVEFVTLEANNFDYANGLKYIEQDALVYRLARGDRAATLNILLSIKGLTGPYKNTDTILSRNYPWGSAIRMQTAGVPIISTIFNLSKNEDARLADYVTSLGGFPVIVKSSGGSHGEGVMKVDSLSSLRSVIGFISDGMSSQFALRTFIESARHLRLIVIGDHVVDTIEYDVQPDDFRTNAVAVPTVVARNDVDQSLKDIAVNATQSLGLEFSGVDILIDASGQPYVAEVNFPCNFARNQMNTGTDIAGMLIDYLIKKATKV